MDIKRRLLVKSKTKDKKQISRTDFPKTAEMMIVDNRFKFSEDELKLGTTPASQLTKLENKINKQTKKMIKASSNFNELNKKYNKKTDELKVKLDLLNFERRAVYETKIYHIVQRDISGTKYRLTGDQNFKIENKEHKEMLKVISASEKRVKKNLDKAEKDLRKYEQKLDKNITKHKVIK